MSIKTSEKNFTEADIIAFAKFFYQGMRRFGLENMQRKMAELYVSQHGAKEQALKEKIFAEISAHYQMSPEAIITSVKRGNTTQAKVIAMLLIHRHMNISQSEIAMLFGRVPSLISRRIKLFNNGTEKFSSNKDFISAYEKINLKVIEFIESWQKKKN